MSPFVNIVVAVNDWSVLEHCVMQSKFYTLNSQSFIFQEHCRSASLSCNSGIHASNSDILIFAHQDVYFPEGWFERLEKIVFDLNQVDPKWGVLGVVGLGADSNVYGRTWSTGLNMEVGSPIQRPQVVQSIDELVIILNRRSGLLFDDDLPGFHLYGTDVVQIAKAQGLSSYGIDAPVIHNSLPYRKFDAGFVEAYRFMQKKWRSVLPIRTLVTQITRFGFPLKKRVVRQAFSRFDRSKFNRLEDPRAKARELGYE